MVDPLHPDKRDPAGPSAAGKGDLGDLRRLRHADGGQKAALDFLFQPYRDRILRTGDGKGELALIQSQTQSRESRGAHRGVGAEFASRHAQCGRGRLFVRQADEADLLHRGMARHDRRGDGGLLALVNGAFHQGGDIARRVENTVTEGALFLL